MSLSADEAEDWRRMSEGDTSTKTKESAIDIKSWMIKHGLVVSEDTYNKLHENGFSTMLCIESLINVIY